MFCIVGFKRSFRTFLFFERTYYEYRKNFVGSVRCRFSCCYFFNLNNASARWTVDMGEHLHDPVNLFWRTPCSRSIIRLLRVCWRGVRRTPLGLRRWWRNNEHLRTRKRHLKNHNWFWCFGWRGNSRGKLFLVGVVGIERACSIDRDHEYVGAFGFRRCRVSTSVKKTDKDYDKSFCRSRKILTGCV